MAVGKIGQDFFKLLCSQAGLVANPPFEDERGWDFFVEFGNPVIDGAIESDRLHEGYLQCKIQVKGSYEPISYSDDIKLSNWHNMCSDPIPYFVALIQIDRDSGKALTLDLIHIDNNYIYKALHRIKQKQKKYPTSRLSRFKMRVNASINSHIDPINGESLKDAICEYIGTSQHDYVIQKTKYLEEVGYEESRGEIKFEVDFAPNSPTIIDVAIGMVDTIPAANFKAFNSRFGIRDFHPYLSEEDGRIGICPESEDVEIVFKTSLLSPEIIFSAKLFNPTLNSIVLPSERKIRLSGSWFNLIFNPNKTGKCSFDVNFDSWMEYDELTSSLKVIAQISEHTKDTQLICRRSSGDISLLRFANVDTVTIPEESKIIIENISKIVEEFNQPPKGMVCLTDFLECKESISSLSKILASTPPIMRTQFSPTEPLADHTKDVAVVSAAPAAIGHNLYVALIVCRGPAIPSDDGWFVVTDPNPIIARYLVINRNDIQWELLNNEMVEVAQAYEITHHVFVSNADHAKKATPSLSNNATTA